ncbi:MAG: hypothetical protein ABIF18_01240 [archaeon]
MINRNIAIGIGILVVVLLGLMFFSNMTGNVITGSVVVGEQVENEYFKINDSNDKSGDDNLNDTQNISGQK